ncbi:MAG TPA: D-glycero-beta-D-manno-heptose-1,7-bisphosphate 7-phosphatase [Gammaproteobacteria bacterium]|nr:D-glycero-beta-D-manno-heptose-1,7-bisphosphate 7-phosphatase [Gammaproteobacteria bacterium]
MKLIILDRDGVINEDSDDYIKSPDEWIPIAGSLEALGKLSQNGFKVIIITNQSGIGRKIFSIEMLNAIHKKMSINLAQYGGVIDGIFFCPCAPEENCNCRKPKSGLYNEVSDRLQISLENVFCVGDKITDIQAAQNARAKPILVKTGKENDDSGNIPKNIPIYDDLLSFVNKIITEKI